MSENVNLEKLRAIITETQLSLEEFRKKAEEMGFKVRVVSTNGNGSFVTMDYRSNRLNVCVDGALETITRRKLDEEMQEVYGTEYLEEKKFDTSTAHVSSIRGIG